MFKNKVFLIGPTESILTKRGNRFPNFADFFVQENVNVVYYTSDFYHAEKRFFSKAEIHNAQSKCTYELNVLSVLGYFNNVSVKRVFSNFFFSLKLFFILLFRVKKHDKILLPSRPVELIFFMSLLKRIKGVGVYLDIQDVWPDALQIANKKKKKIFEVYCNSYLKPSLKYYTGTIHTAPSFKNWLRRYALNTPSNFVPLGWENKRWEVKKEHSLTNNYKVIQFVCIAQLQYQIDVMPILEVLKDEKDYFLTIIGEDGKGERYDEVVHYIRNNNIENVRIVGKVERNDMINQLRHMDIGILPMITSSIPNKIFDYLAAYLPIIVLGENDSANLVNDYKIGWSCKFNAEDLNVLMRNLRRGDIETKKEQVLKIRNEFSRDQLHQKIKELVL